VLLLNYNVSPWLYTKKFFVLLTLLIPEKEFVIAKVLEIYLELVVDVLLEL